MSLTRYLAAYAAQSPTDLGLPEESDKSFNPGEAAAVDQEKHSILYRLTPYISLTASLVALALGVATAISIIHPVKRMGLGMRKIASGDLADATGAKPGRARGTGSRINQTAVELGHLHAAALAEKGVARSCLIGRT